MISHIKIEGFKCFEKKVKIPLKTLNVLAGGNSVGKSSVIQALLLLKSSWENPQTPLNGNYLLNLGNSTQILSKKGKDNKIYVEYHNNSSIIARKWTIDLSNPEVFLSDSQGSKNDKTSLLDKSIFHYLHAERLGPRPFHSIGIEEKNVGWQGENAIAILSSEAVEKPNYNVHSSLMFPQSENPKLRHQLELWMKHIVPGIDVSPKRVKEINQSYILYNDNSPYNVGFGISYVLPIITVGLIARSGEMFIVENPEAHLHPSGQSRIGYFLAKVANSGVQVIIETHSEHVINGIRLASLEKEISHDNVVIHFFSKKEDQDQPDINTIFLNENADLDDWPLGFFDQQQQDIARIFKLRKEKRK